MDSVRGIRRLGFARWYERRLMESHAWLATSFLCLVALMALFEGFSFKGPDPETPLRFVGMAVATFLGWHALKRYIAIMKEADRFASRSTCLRCKSHGAFDVLREEPPGVRCRRCGYEWGMG